MSSKATRHPQRVFCAQREHGIVEDVKESPREHTGQTHYLAHHAVIRRDKQTTKVHIVYDASARSKGPLLNDCLYSDPNLIRRSLIYS